MKITSRLVVAITMLLCIGFCGHAADARQARRKSVLDYSLLLPNKYFEHSFTSRQQRLNNLFGKESSDSPYRVVDIPNDFITFHFDAIGTLQVAVFRHRGRDLIALRRYYDGGGFLTFLRLEKGRWKDVTKQVMPVAYSNNNYYELPRYGTTIQVFVDNLAAPTKRKKAYRLLWRNGRFVKSKSSTRKRLERN